jgi:hypothetical protein
MSLTPGEPVANYDATQVDLLLCGIPVDGGLADGVFISIKQNQDDYGMTKGADGSTVRYATNDRSATVEVTLLQTAKANSLFAALRTAGLLVPGGADIAPFMIRDKLGTCVYAGKECWIQKPPDVDFDRKDTERKWIIQVPNMVRYDGGSA